VLKAGGKTPEEEVARAGFFNERWALAEPEKPATEEHVRIDSGVSGHIHPAACVTKKGTVLVIYSRADMKDLHQSRSTDGGRTWSKPVPFPHTAKVSIY